LSTFLIFSGNRDAIRTRLGSAIEIAQIGEQRFLGRCDRGR